MTDINLVESDDMVRRNRIGRVAIFVLALAVTHAVPMYFVGFILGRIPFAGSDVLGYIIGFVIGGWAFSRILPRFFVRVPQAQVFVTTNNWWPWGNPNVKYGPGDHFAFPQEQRGRKSNLPLAIITIPFTENVPGRDTELLATGSYQFKVDIRISDHFIGVDESTIRGGVIDLIKSKVSSELSNEDDETAKAKLPEINAKLENEFGLIRGAQKTHEVNDFERHYGIQTVALTISGIDLPPDVQATRNAVAEARKVFAGIAGMLGVTERELRRRIKAREYTSEEYIELLDRFAVFSKNAVGNVQMLKLRGLEGASLFLGNLVGGAQKGGKK